MNFNFPELNFLGKLKFREISDKTINLHPFNLLQTLKKTLFITNLYFSGKKIIFKLTLYNYLRDINVKYLTDSRTNLDEDCTS